MNVGSISTGNIKNRSAALMCHVLMDGVNFNFELGHNVDCLCDPEPFINFCAR